MADYGVILAEPHPSIAHEEYYKHIHDELLEPQRMKQLLAWCGRKALTPKDGKVGDATAAAVGRYFFFWKFVEMMMIRPGRRSRRVIRRSDGISDES